ncbi:MAG: hypothetical protein KF855_03230 [Acidobacteria bacterium]|nr:hypothetical protein [Acidobacteriota bacterium]
MKSQPEFLLQSQIAEYLRKAHPRILFLSDVRASLSLTIPQARRSKLIQADGFACPDLVIFAARRGFYGLFLEIKAETPFKIDGTLKRRMVKRNGREYDHLAEQQKAIDNLRKSGYKAEFVWKFNDAADWIDWYLKESNQQFAARLGMPPSEGS